MSARRKTRQPHPARPRASGRRQPPAQVLVTGGAGFIGSHLVERLLADGKRVVVIDDLSTGRLANLSAVRRHPALRMIESKVSEYRGLPQLMSRAESVYHLAAAVGVENVVKSPIATIRTNLDETEVVLETAAPHGVPLLITSTSEVYGRSQKSSFSENDDLLIGPPDRGRWSYACSKLMDEFLALAYARERRLPVVIARLFNTVGPRQTGRYGMVLPRFIEAAKRSRPLQVHDDGEQSRCFCYVQDAVEALVRLQHTPAARGEVFNVGSTEEISIRELARLVIEVLGSRSPIEFVPYDKAYAPGFDDMRRRRPNVDKLESVTDFRPSTLLRRIIQLTAEAV